MRAMNLSNVLVDAGHKVVLWSSAFYHQEKRHRSTTQQSIRVSSNLEIRLIPSCGYKRNIGMGRLVDHAQLAINLKKMLKQCKDVPDVAFIGYPPIETAAVLVRWLAKRGVPSLLDVKDQWPSIFLEAMPSFIRPLGRIILWPYFRLAEHTMQNATGISAMANGFLNWSLGFARRDRLNSDQVFPLTTPLGQVSAYQLSEARQWWDDQGILDDGRPRVCFVGSHSQTFDFKPVYEAAKTAFNESKDWQFVICGDGSTSAEIREGMAGFPNVHFPGWVDRPKIEALAERCRASLAPYLNTEDFRMSIPNKIIDSLSLGLPILSSLQGEVASLISEHGVGMLYGADTGKTLHDCIQALMQDTTLEKRMSQNAGALYEARFSFEMVYGGLVKHLEMLANSRLVS
jgi:glycosyltransferase involved in cell wall biosynthesis